MRQRTCGKFLLLIQSAHAENRELSIYIQYRYIFVLLTLDTSILQILVGREEGKLRTTYPRGLHRNNII